VAPITDIHQQRTANNERRKESKLALLGPNVSNNTSPSHSIAVENPSIDTATTPSNVSVVRGKNAYLVCSVMNLGENVVSWLRHKDTNLLSVGKDKYTQDPRYQVFHDGHAETWTMKVMKTRSNRRASAVNRIAFAD
jgi:hypothetical protein